MRSLHGMCSLNNRASPTTSLNGKTTPYTMNARIVYCKVAALALLVARIANFYCPHGVVAN